VPQVIIQPAGNQGGREHYRDTIEKPVPLDRIAPRVGASVHQQLTELFPSRAIATWGVTPGANQVNERKWERIADGDVALFLKESHAYAAGTVALKARAPELARELWGSNERGETWEFVYFLKDVHEIDLPYGELNGLLGYEDANQFQGFNVVTPERSAALLARLGVAAPSATSAVRYWWVNQGTSFRQESAGGFVWAPKRSKSGAALAPYANVARLRLGDAILHYANGVRAVGTVAASPMDVSKPADVQHDQWGSDGVRAKVTYRALSEAIPLADIPHAWRSKEAAETTAGPFTRDGSVKLGYLYPLSDEFIARLFERFPQLREGQGQVMNTERGLSTLAERATRDFERAGLQFDRDAVTRFSAALMAKPFVILTGLSGSGKTKLAQGFAEWLGCNSASGKCSVVAVGPDWTSKDSALGYPNALDQSAYARTQTLDLILRAVSRPDEPFFLVLDEMNLSHVERYFADILSAMESGEAIHLHSGPEDRQGVPPALPLPKNLHIIGTVNVDETTYMFSPKVLDRAHVLEFRASRAQLATVIRESRRPNLSLLTGLGSEFAGRFVGDEGREELPDVIQRKLDAEVTLFFDVLAHEGYEFGYRTAIEVAEFVRAHRQLSGANWRFEDAIDSEVLQKLLPRVHGSQRQIEGVMRALAVSCFEARTWSPDGSLSNQEALRGQAADAAKLTSREWDPLTNPKYETVAAAYPRSFDKIKRMLRQLDRNGFTSFAEA
jgi:MoxR-like ATPase